MARTTRGSSQTSPAGGPNARRPAAFSLVELVIVILILALVAAIAVPRFQFARDRATEKTLQASLTALRRAIDWYQAEHEGRLPDAAAINEQLTRYTSLDGDVDAAQSPSHPYGPYLRRIPALPLGANQGDAIIAAADGPNVGWIYDEQTGNIRANTTAGEVDTSGVSYASY